MNIQHTHDQSKGAFFITENGINEARMSYSIASATLIIIDHTEVNPKFSGKGLGKLLVLEAVKYARENGIKIIPLCPFAKSVFDKTLSLRDVLK